MFTRVRYARVRLAINFIWHYVCIRVSVVALSPGRYEEGLRSRGVTLMSGRTMSGVDVSTAEGVAVAEAVTLDNGERLPASLVVAGVGAKIDLSLFDGLKTSAGGIEVDGRYEVFVNPLATCSICGHTSIWGTPRCQSFQSIAHKLLPQAITPPFPPTLSPPAPPPPPHDTRTVT